MAKQVGIICTIGPSSFRKVKQLRKAGMSIARLNFAYAKNEQLDLLKGIPAMADVRKVEHLKKIPKKYQYAAVSFVNSAAQMKAARKLTKAKLIAKIETRRGMKNLKQIVKASDMIMVARGDLSEAVGFENLGAAQHRIIAACKRARKPFIIATGVLESMTKKPKPHITEAVDIANSVKEGASYIMLSDETAIGKYPIQAAKFLKKAISNSK